MASSSKEQAELEPSNKKMKMRSVLSKKLDSISKRKPASKPVFCPHCEDKLSTKTFKKHRMLYYNETSRIWSKLGNCSTSSDMSEGNFYASKLY